jgi:hypothetical protein
VYAESSGEVYNEMRIIWLIDLMCARSLLEQLIVLSVRVSQWHAKPGRAILAQVGVFIDKPYYIGSIIENLLSVSDDVS